MIEILKSKVNKIVNTSPSINDFLNEGFDLDYAKEISGDFKISLKDNLDESISDNLPKLFSKNVELKNFSFFGFILNPFEEHKDFIHIGNRDIDLIIIVKKTQEVVLLDGNTLEIISYLSGTFTEFLDIIPILVSYSKIGFLGKRYTPEIKKQTLAMLENIPLKSKYLSYYQDVIGQ